MSFYYYYPEIFDIIKYLYDINRVAVDSDNTYVKVGGVIVRPTVTIKEIKTAVATRYTDLVVEAQIQFSSNGGTVEEIKVALQLYHFHFTERYEMCVTPRFYVGSGTTTLTLQYITRFYTTS